MSASPWKIAQHGPLTLVTEGLWVVDAELDSVPIGRRMTIIQAGTGELLIHSAIACNEETMRRIDALGPVGTIIVPSASHKIDAPGYAARYPNARVLAPEAARAQVEQVVAVQGNYGELASGGRLRVEMLDGIPTEGVFIHADPEAQVTLIFNDALMNLPDRLPGFKGFILKLLGSTGGPKVTFIARRFILRDARAFKAHLRRLADIAGLRRIIVSHGATIDENAPDVLRQVAETLG